LALSVRLHLRSVARSAHYTHAAAVGLPLFCARTAAAARFHCHVCTSRLTGFAGFTPFTITHAHARAHTRASRTAVRTPLRTPFTPGCTHPGSALRFWFTTFIFTTFAVHTCVYRFAFNTRFTADFTHSRLLVHALVHSSDSTVHVYLHKHTPARFSLRHGYVGSFVPLPRLRVRGTGTLTLRGLVSPGLFCIWLFAFATHTQVARSLTFRLVYYTASWFPFTTPLFASVSQFSAFHTLHSFWFVHVAWIPRFIRGSYAFRCYTFVPVLPAFTLRVPHPHGLCPTPRCTVPFTLRLRLHNGLPFLSLLADTLVCV